MALSESWKIPRWLSFANSSALILSLFSDGPFSEPFFGLTLLSKKLAERTDTAEVKLLFQYFYFFSLDTQFLDFSLTLEFFEIHFSGWQQNFGPESIQNTEREFNKVRDKRKKKTLTLNFMSIHVCEIEKFFGFFLSIKFEIYRFFNFHHTKNIENVLLFGCGESTKALSLWRREFFPNGTNIRFLRLNGLDNFIEKFWKLK